MNKYLLRTVLFLLPVFLTLGTMEYLLQKIPNNYSYKKNYMDKNAEEIQILILGSSQIFYGIDASCFSQNAFNLANPSETYYLSLELFKKYQKKLNHLNTIIISYSYHTLWSSRLAVENEIQRSKNYILYYRINITENINNYFELLNGKTINNLRRLNKYYIKKKNDVTCTQLGLAWGLNRSNKDLVKTGKEAAIRHTRDNIHSKENIRILEENIIILDTFAEICNKNDIKLILINTPKYNTYIENLNKEQMEEAAKTVDLLIKKHKNIIYINWQEDKDFFAKDFYDADHLNSKGAEKLSKKLDSYISSL
ncbi:MAG: hypothetical protein LBH16_07550 [Treponema sp.]|jgi:hypothetical protein|nr:hypothetical protein [Treponema sp.]